MTGHTIIVESYNVVNKVKVTRLTKLQKLVCKLFHITPEEKYGFTIGIRTNAKNPVHVGDCLLLVDKTNWVVTGKNCSYFEIDNIELLPSFVLRIGDELIIYANSWCEGNGSPTSKY